MTALELLAGRLVSLDELTRLSVVSLFVDTVLADDDSSCLRDDSVVADESVCLSLSTRLVDVSAVSTDLLSSDFAGALVYVDDDTMLEEIFAPFDVFVETLTIALAALNAKIIETSATGVITGGVRYAIMFLLPWPIILGQLA